jgi:hypothetical protein
MQWVAGVRLRSVDVAFVGWILVQRAGNQRSTQGPSTPFGFASLRSG